MRILISGDWHANEAHAELVFSCAERNSADAIVQLGDFGYNYTDSFLKTIAGTPCPLYFIDGNHDNFDLLWGDLKLPPNVHYMERGSLVTFGGLRCVALGGGYSIDKQYRQSGVSWWYQELIRQSDVALALEHGTCDVMFTHDAPIGCSIGLGYKDDPNTEQNRTALQHVVNELKPKLLFHGHWHRRMISYAADVRCEGLDCDVGFFSDNVAIFNTETGEVK